MITGLSYDQLKTLAGTHFCYECGGLVGIAYVNGEWVLRCGNNIDHKGLTLHDKEEERRRDYYRMESTKLQKLTENQMMARVNMGPKFLQDLTAVDRRKLARIATDYGFDPAMGEMTIYQGRPYVSADGRYRKAQETGKLAGVESRPATREEREAHQVPEGDFFYRATVNKREKLDSGQYAVDQYIGWGKVLAVETKGSPNLPVVKNPQRMAEKRAEVQALRKAFHIPLPSMEYMGTEEEADIIESTARDLGSIDDKHLEKTTDTKPTFGDALTWAHSYGKQFDRKWFLDNCGFSEKELQDEPVKVETAIQNICAFTSWKYERK